MKAVLLLLLVVKMILVFPYKSLVSEFVSKCSSIPKYSCAEIVTVDRTQGDCASPVPPGDAEKSRTGEQDPGLENKTQLPVLEKAHEFFQISDLEGKGFITHQDIQRLHLELPSLEELDKVFVTLDADGNGSLSPKEFTTRFSEFRNYDVQAYIAWKRMSRKKQKKFRRISANESDVKQLWLQLRKDDPRSLSGFEEFLFRIFSEIQEVDNEKNSLECALKRKIAADDEIQHLYEEKEQQIKEEQFLLKEYNKSSQYAPEAILESFSDTLQREKSGLLKQLDNLRERNKHLKDEHDIFLQKCKTIVPKVIWKKRSGSATGKYIEGNMLPNSHSFEDDAFNNSKKRNSAGLNEVLPVEPDAGAAAPHLQRITSAEEDHLPQVLDRLVDKQLNTWTGEDENTSSEMEMEKKNTEESVGHSLSSSREQHTGKEALSNLAFKTRQIREATGFIEPETNVCAFFKEERINSVPEHLFKIIFVVNLSVGKTSFLRFCEDCFFPGTAATIDVDYNVKTIIVDNIQVALQLWGTTGQEQYRSVTKQFFREDDGVIVVYDTTAKDTLTAVKQLISTEETTVRNVPVILLGNKTDNEKEREIPMGMGEHLAKDYDLIFYERSVYSGYSTFTELELALNLSLATVSRSSPKSTWPT
ncbi:LOW QUALITY PROTEIN: EF-hand calcium-binding domain-containing protein 4B [Rhynochetos jubatus]